MLTPTIKDEVMQRHNDNHTNAFTYTNTPTYTHTYSHTHTYILKIHKEIGIMHALKKKKVESRGGRQEERREGFKGKFMYITFKSLEIRIGKF